MFIDVLFVIVTLTEILHAVTHWLRKGFELRRKNIFFVFKFNFVCLFLCNFQVLKRQSHRLRSSELSENYSWFLQNKSENPQQRSPKKKKKHFKHFTLYFFRQCSSNWFYKCCQVQTRPHSVGTVVPTSCLRHVSILLLSLARRCLRQRSQGWR